jgi:hypothetical protein
MYCSFFFRRKRALAAQFRSCRTEECTRFRHGGNSKWLTNRPIHSVVVAANSNMLLNLSTEAAQQSVRWIVTAKQAL